MTTAEAVSGRSAKIDRRRLRAGTTGRALGDTTLADAAVVETIRERHPGRQGRRVKGR